MMIAVIVFGDKSIFICPFNIVKRATKTILVSQSYNKYHNGLMNQRA